jgi:mannosyltransferase OCH1-like enzyme
MNINIFKKIKMLMENNKSDISNICIVANNKDSAVYNYEIVYINENSFKILIAFLVGNHCYSLDLNIMNKYGNENITINIKSGDNWKIINTPFKLIKEDNKLKGNISKIIHQSYREDIKPRLRNAMYTWQLMNNNYKYMYWTDEKSDKYIYDLEDERIKEAYFSLYARAYKSDILRLCILYEYGGIWTDMSSECIICLDRILDNESNLHLVIDHPSQINNGNIYQAFIAVEPKNNIIKYVLDFTIDRVLHFKDYDGTYPWIANQTVAVTGPTIFAIALNKYLNRNPRDKFTEEIININNNKIFFYDHKIIFEITENLGYILFRGNKIIRTKYDNYNNDRTTPHYSNLFTRGYIIKKKINLLKEEQIKENNNNLYQIWISDKIYDGNYISEKMFNAIKTWKELNPEINYIFLENNLIIDIIKKDDEFPLLLRAYNRIKAFAFKADLIRYYMIYKYGGIYTDIDSYCVNPLKDLFRDFDIVLSYDVDVNRISNAFLYSKKSREILFKKLLNECIYNILERNHFDSDLDISGPLFFSKVLNSLYYLDKNRNEHYIDGLKLLTIKYHIDLPLPNGCWRNSSINSIVKYNKLITYCRSTTGEYKRNEIYFLPNDYLRNDNGRIIDNSNVIFNLSNGSGFYINNNKIYCVSKYEGYNEERHILGGNDFAELYSKGLIF